MGEDALAGLNPEQRQAVEHRSGPILVLAGAGSGKTRVIARRIQRLMAEGEPPAGIVALTFTNKAAREMRGRLPTPCGEVPFLGTFHAWGLRLLRRHAPLVGLPHDFAVLDRADQEAQVRDCLKELAGGEAFSERRARLALSRAKNNLRPLLGPPPLADLAALYERRLRAARAVDFDDLLVLPLRLLDQHPDVRARARPAHVLVDEFQDTNPAQARLLERLWPETGDVCVVGDEDQSIYRFRGASPENLRDFPRAHPETRVVRLERNYRSTPPILAAAAAVVGHNRERLGKTLRAERSGGEPVLVRRLASAEDEAAAVVEEAERMAGRFGPGEVAILYRTNAQSRPIEEQLVRRGVGYRLVKGQRFYERREVKDVLAYLRLVASPADDTAFLRVVNVPARGIGPALLGEVSERAGTSGGLLAAAEALAHEATTAGRRLQPFASLIRRLRERAAALTPAELVREVVAASGYGRHLERAGESEAGERRGDNIEELARKAEADGLGPGLEPLRDFLDAVTIAAEPEEGGAGALSLMTLHNAKGLEFQGVVIAGVEEGLLPHVGTGADGGEEQDVEEERRLLYVGMTRAREALVLTCALSRPLWGDSRRSRPSRFLDELPRGQVRFAGPSVEVPAEVTRAPLRRAAPAPAPGPSSLPRPASPGTPADDYAVGGWVRHAVYGDGLILEREGSGDGLKLGVRFSSGLRKKFQCRYAGLKPLRKVRPG